MNADFLERIDQPRSLTLERLLDSAIENVDEQLREYGAHSVDDWALRKIAYTYYYDWEEDDPDYVFLLEDPGNLNQRHTREVRRIEALKEEHEPLDMVDIYRRFASTWFTETRNSDFMRKFLSTCDENGLIDADGYWKDYIRTQDFFDDFYMTDIVKYRAPGSAVGAQQVRSSFADQLRLELETIDPDLIFTFGNRGWNPVKEELRAEPVDDPDVDESKITELHGHLHQTQRIVDSYVLPLGHMSTQFYGAQISKDDYMGRLENGLENWRQVAGDELSPSIVD
jgi:hypothetical protein